MIALHARTVAAQQTALAERELRPVARPLEDAAAAQLQAVSALRRAPADRERAQASERVSLEELERALEEARRLQEQIEEEAIEREREKLEEAYREALKSQVGLRDQTRAAAPEGRVDRRARMELRRLAGAQAELGAVIEDLFRQTQELEDAIVFRFAHERLDAAIDDAEARLLDAEATAATARQDRAIALLRGLVEALERDENQEQEFDDDGGGGGGGGQQGAQPELIPSGVQLKLLRAIQVDVRDRTREADEGQAGAGDLESLAREQRELSEIGARLIEELTPPEPPAGVPQGPEGGAP